MLVYALGLVFRSLRVNRRSSGRGGLGGRKRGVGLSVPFVSAAVLLAPRCFPPCSRSARAVGPLLGFPVGRGVVSVCILFKCRCSPRKLAFHLFYPLMRGSSSGHAPSLPAVTAFLSFWPLHPSLSLPRLGLSFFLVLTFARFQCEERTWRSLSLQV